MIKYKCGHEEEIGGLSSDIVINAALHLKWFCSVGEAGDRSMC